MDVLARFLNGFLMLAMPLGLGVLLARRLGQRWGLFGAGVVSFFVSQVLHLPFNARILNPVLSSVDPTSTAGLALLAVLLGLSAGAFEELSRYAVLRFWRREARSWRQALMFGAGHGGLEAFAIGIIVVLGFFQALAYRGADLTTLVPPERLDVVSAQFEVYWALPWPQALLGALERMFALSIHLSLAVLVMRAFTKRNHIWLAAAIGWHTLVDAVAVAGVQTLGAVRTELLIGLMALISLAIMFRLRDKPAGGEASIIEASRPTAEQPAYVRNDEPPSEEKIDETRYMQG
jgi:uncharacterized membrane protein YhfC